MDTARFRYLYYPEFEPDLDWLKRVLLLTDEVTRLIPKSANHVDSDGMQKLIELFPESVTRLSPEPRDVALSPTDLNRLNTAFSLLTPRGTAKPVVISIGSDQMRIRGGHVFLNAEKVSAAVKDLLIQHRLLNEHIAAIAGVPDYSFVVEEEAANLVVSLLADNIARTHGLSTITSRDLDFAMNALTDSEVRRAKTPQEAEGRLLNAIAAVSIPAITGTLRWEEYKVLRKSYADLRPAFQTLMRQLMSMHRLDSITDYVTLEARVNEVANDFNKEVDRYRKTQYAQQFIDWTPVCLGGVVSIAAPLISDDPKFVVAMSGITFALTIIDKIRNPDSPVTPEAYCQKLIAKLRDDIHMRYCDRFLV